MVKKVLFEVLSFSFSVFILEKRGIRPSLFCIFVMTIQMPILIGNNWPLSPKRPPNDFALSCAPHFTTSQYLSGERNPHLCLESPFGVWAVWRNLHPAFSPIVSLDIRYFHYAKCRCFLGVSIALCLFRLPAKGSKSIGANSSTVYYPM